MNMRSFQFAIRPSVSFHDIEAPLRQALVAECVFEEAFVPVCVVHIDLPLEMLTGQIGNLTTAARAYMPVSWRGREIILKFKGE